ncbi:MAG: hypothetical protein WEB58_00690 [Planctomycetaceae bacterium]
MPTYEALTPLVAFEGFTKSGDFQHVPVDRLKTLDGLAYTEECFVTHMDEPVSSYVVKSNGIRLSLNADNGQLTAVTHFETPRELTEEEISQLKRNYDGQMSDGIGENFLSEIQARADVPFRLEVFWLYDTSKGSQVRGVA